MAKVLIGIIACHKHRNRIEAQRESWIHAVRDADARFFFGQGATLLGGDEIFLNVPDDYDHLFAKVRAMCQWALERDYTNLFKCDTDTWIQPRRLLEQSDFGLHDYIGLEGIRSGGRYALGGTGYWLSRRAMACIARSNPVIPPGGQRLMEDVVVGTVLRANGIFLQKDVRYWYRPFELEVITRAELSPEEMKAAAIRVVDSPLGATVYEKYSDSKV